MDPDHDHGHEHEHGHRMCDWRVGLADGCPDASFFESVYLGLLVITSCTLFLLLFILVFRITVLKDSLASFKQGDNGGHLFLIFSHTCTLILACLLVGHYHNRIAGEVFWCLSQSAYLGPIYIHLHAIIGATPGLRTREFNVPKFILNQTVRGTILICSFFTFAALCVTLMCLADLYEDLQNHEVAHALWKAGLVSMFIINTYNSAVVIFFTYHFKSAANERLKSIREDLKEEKEEYEVLRLTLAKTNRMYYDAMAVAPLGALIFLSLAFYEDFFSNLVFSKVAAVILDIGLTAPMFFISLGAAYVDIRKYKLLVHRSSQGGSSSHNKHDVKMNQESVTSVVDPMQEFLDSHTK